MALRERDAAEHHRLKAVRNGESGQALVRCECADLRCNATLDLTRAERASLRARPGRFSVAPGHALVDIDRVIEENERYTVVLIPGMTPYGAPRVPLSSG